MVEIFISILMVRDMDENCGIRGIDNHSQAFPATASISDHLGLEFVKVILTIIREE